MPVNILVADDDKAILRLYSRIFSGEGYALTKAETFAEASRLLLANDYDLLITDLMFPDGVGTELIKIFNGSKADARSLLVTGTPQAKEMLDHGGVDYVAKPFKVEHFLERVNKILS
ncbi:MAG: response regulator [Elusimicrobiales bacterium]|nr:response regulator [Elusimicrobiales bacterium]